MSKAAIWKSIAETISAEIASGQYKAGDKLPSENDFATRFGVNRHTVRHALSHLTESGIIRTRRGAGAFVTTKPTDYALGRRVRFAQNVLASGRSPSRKITHQTTRACDEKEAKALALPLGALVHVVEGVSFIDGTPASQFRSVFDAERFPDILRSIEDYQSVTKALLACGVRDYTRASTRIIALNASAVMALALQISAGSAILRSIAVNVDQEGRPVEYGTTWFAGERVTLTIEPD